MSISNLARTSLTVQAAIALGAVVLTRVAVRILRRWLGDDFLDATTASMIVTALDGLVLLAVSAVAVGLRRALSVQAGPSSHTVYTPLPRPTVPMTRKPKITATRPPPKRGKAGRFEP